MRPMEPPKLKRAEVKSTDQNRHRKVPGMVKRLRRSGILGRVIELGKMSDGAVIQHGQDKGLRQDRSFREHQQRLFGAIERLAGLSGSVATRSHDKVAVAKGIRVVVTGDWTHYIPAKVETAIQASALKALGERK